MLGVGLVLQRLLLVGVCSLWVVLYCIVWCFVIVNSVGITVLFGIWFFGLRLFVG